MTETTEARRRTATRWPVRRWAALLAAVEAVLLIAAITGGAVGLSNLGDARGRLVDRADPQLIQANTLSTALVNQETGARGYLISGQNDFLEPYTTGRQQQDQAVASLRRLGAVDGTQAGADLTEVLAAAARWQALATTWTDSAHPTATTAQLDQSKTLFDAVRTSFATQRADLVNASRSARTSLNGASNFLTAMLITVGALLLVLFGLLYLGFRYVVARPIFRLAAEVRLVSEEDIHRHVEGSGPRELIELGADIETMRQRIVDEVGELHRAHSLLDKRTEELERSNSDLEQFAYVASHDLQEPLRKVASFTQLLQRRYQGQLDDRADQYIEFAVDGAKRMQILINDLLSFSRVGRRVGEPVVLDTGALLGQAVDNLETSIAETGAVITHGELPEVRGEASLLTAVFQNLVNNAIKFHGEQAPEVRVEAVRDDDTWTFSVSDNGIGIEPEYAERIFAIFQRLHPKSAYPGTGIGLAVCRKIVEHHGGQIWLDTQDLGRTTFCFTLPVLAGPQPELTVETNEVEEA
ncbi:MAG: histidine kinase [Amycolatopsis sp.]|uniref:sensor histidine kinase n=1 Tax=Amycolatopsis sp. TaxID=37632 RepID=UPI00260A0DC5|nr:sensor histidine kinase [Amycolatopsis sp.]MCU1685276.1 histidine kinase [Amycolatopsis sp.]